MFYLACLLLNDPHYYQIGGLDEAGNSLISEFSYMVLEAADLLNSACNITVRGGQGHRPGVPAQGGGLPVQEQERGGPGSPGTTP